MANRPATSCPSPHELTGSFYHIENGSPFLVFMHVYYLLVGLQKVLTSYQFEVHDYVLFAVPLRPSDLVESFLDTMHQTGNSCLYCSL